MSDAGLWKDIVGQDPFAKCGIKLWWAKVHSICKLLYILLIFAFGILSVIKRPSCVPADRNDSSLILTTPEASFIAEVCATKAPWFVNPDSTCPSVIYVVLLAEECSISITKRYLSNPLSLFGKALTLHEESNMSLAEIKRYISEPNFLVEKSKDCSTARRIALLLHSCSTCKAQWAFVFREWFLFFIFALNALMLFIIDSIGAGLSYDNPAFECVFNESDDAFWSSNVSSTFMCTHPWTVRDADIVLYYYYVLSVHCCSLFAGAVIFLKCRKVSQNDTTLLLKNLWAIGRTMPEMEFGAVANIALSSDCRKMMKKNIELVGTDADLQFTKMVESLTGFRTVNSKPNLGGLIENRRWDWIVSLLEIFPEPFDDLEPLKKVDTSTLDLTNDTGTVEGEKEPFLKQSEKHEIDGRSLLFYALNRKSGCRTFQARAAKRILDCSKGKERIVCYNGGKVPAREFVEMQYVSDQEYPERVKEMLLRYI